MTTVGLEVTFSEIVSCAGAIIGVPLAALSGAVMWAKQQFDACSKDRTEAAAEYKKIKDDYYADKVQMSLEIRELQTEQRVYKQFNPVTIAEHVVKTIEVNSKKEKKAES